MNSLQRIGALSIGQMRKLNSNFFEPNSMQFFSSVVHGKTNVFGLFITSEQFDDDTPRYFTVRKIDMEGNVENISEFQQFATFADARKYRSEFGRQGTQ